MNCYKAVADLYYQSCMQVKLGTCCLLYYYISVSTASTNETGLNESTITEDMKQATDYAQVLVSCSKCDTTCMHGWRGSVQGKDQQQTLKPQMKLRGSIGDAHKICEDAGKLSLPQATDTPERL